MPALNLPDGRLLRPHEINQWVAEQFCQNGRPKLDLPSKETDEWLKAKLEDQAAKTFEELEACLQQPDCMLKHDKTSITWLEISLIAYFYLVQNIIKPVIVDSNFQSKFLIVDRQNDFSQIDPIHRWSYQLPFINHFETIHTGPLVSLISHGGLSVGLSLMDSL
ncbi:hypothetical protein PPACK8108_LOCUS11449 [Phakopsora pachyrhizi]|uniref:Uncharacterized protein n=1 Tax=Phakopsora pachyrhizi TaxID=170000 RepID=A0AAV0B3M8_PHAPC|nr:hypothetical protein PPACK8108_LOCUS11449 [Phakopsora pachyrhizi]